ncbi:YsnF/AvaK domain-containing protein [Massilia sp. CF038]|uniref:YsnF/AvaK domain-containing protein n=1 Tax=Massilia sp. CF038 TaxID=1881045 RepID=UPI00091ADCEE|nr:YsnF/AvaK domain-containing protein [Massilia sp. CF038]SHG74273.1 conserved domain-containing protein [Massilia sp. CF038]
MQHTLIAVFDNRGDAQRALDELVASGFSRQDAHLSEGDTSGQSDLTGSSTGIGADAGADADAGSSIAGSLRHFFSDIFGTERSEHASMYSEAVSRGHYVLTLDADSEPEVERAADIVERFGPVDIDEHARQWAGQDAARMGASGMQQSASMSQQSAGSVGAGAGNVQGGQMDDLSVANQGSLQGGTASASQQRADDATAIPVIQEELKVGKRAVQRGGVRIVQRVVETPVNETIGLREEHVNVERHAVDRPASPADLNAFQETTIELRESAEEAVVEKTARVVEEVVVGKEVSERSEQISDTVRRTEVEIEQLSPTDDAYFRGHWTSNFANEGGSYEDYAPAYSYGSSMARSTAYGGRQWNDVESNLRSDWEQRYPQSAWEKIKAAVRHGWDRMTS